MIIEIPRRCEGSLTCSGVLHNSCFIPCSLNVFYYVEDFYHKVQDYKNQGKGNNNDKHANHDWSTGWVTARKKESSSFNS